MAVPAALALAGALLHVMNHGLFKCLLFLGVGVVLEQAGQRRLDALGGLLHNMPVLGWAMLVGALSAAAVPPLSGFASEWLLLQALLGAWRSCRGYSAGPCDPGPGPGHAGSALALRQQLSARA